MNHTVQEVLIQLGYSMVDILGRPGRSVVYELNGKMKVVKGGPGKSVEIKLNGKPATLRTKVEHGDRLDVGMPGEGRNGETSLGSIIPPIMLKNADNVVAYNVPASVNGTMKNGEYEINDGDVINYDRVRIKQVREFYVNKLGRLKFYINGKYEEISPYGIKIFSNGLELVDENSVEAGDVLDVVVEKRDVTVFSMMPDTKNGIKIKLNGKETILEKDNVIFDVNGVVAGENYVIRDGDRINYRSSEESGFIVADVLKKFDIDIKNVRDYVLEKNHEETSFTSKLNEDDEVTFTWTMKN